MKDRTTDLTIIPLIGNARAKVLNDLGIMTAFDLLSREPSEISSYEQVKKCDVAFSKLIPLIYKYAWSIVKGKIIITGVDEKLLHIANSEIYFLDLEYNPNTPIFLFGLMDTKGKVTQIFVEDPLDEKKVLEDFLNISGIKRPIFITYASKAADEPVLKKSVGKFEIPTSKLYNINFHDLFFDCIFTSKISSQRIFLPFKPITEKTVSNYFGYMEPKGLKIHDGLQALQAYGSYMKKRNDKIREQLLLYNRSDLERIRLIYEKLHFLFSKGVQEENIFE